jgi:hypothetical protein
MRSIRTGPTVILMALVLSGCSGGGGGDDGEALFAGADARRLAEISPAASGWPDWPARPVKKKKSSGVTLEEVLERDPLYAEYHRRTSKLAGDLDARDGGNRWEDGNKLANLSIGTYASSADAGIAYDAGSDLSRGYGGQHGVVTKAEDVEGIGDEAWRLWATGNGAQVTYQWRRGNLVGEVHIHCFGSCPSDVDAATRAWAEAIDDASQESD